MSYGLLLPYRGTGHGLLMRSGAHTGTPDGTVMSETVARTLWREPRRNGNCAA